MPNTTIQLKRSGSSSNTPTVLDFGELAINYTDGKLFYKHSNGTIVSFSSGAGGDSFGTINANGTLVVADTPGDVLNLIAGNNITFGVDTVNDIITINASGGTADVSAPFAAANAAFLAANSAFANGNTNFTIFQVASGVANNGWLQANTARSHANAAFLAANTLTKLSRRDIRTIYPANTTNGYIEVGFTSWNNNSTSPYADFVHLRSYTDATGGNDNLLMFRKDAIGMRLWQHSYFATTPYSTFKDVAFTSDLATGNAAFLAANAAFANANTTHTLTIAAFSAANASFANSNTNFNTLQTVFGVTNAAFLAANSAFANGNTTHTLTVASFGAANAAFANANSTHTLTIAAFAAANASFANANSTHTLTIASFAAANAAFANANTTHTLTIAAFNAANASFANGNTNFTTLQTVFGVANAAFANANTTHTLAIAAFTQANTANNLTVANTGTVVGSRNVLNFIPGANVVITFTDDAVGNRVNVSIDSVSSGGGGSGALSYTTNIGDNSANTFNITHALNTTTIIPAVREIATGYYVYPDMKVTSPNNIVLEFVSVPTTDQYFLILLGA